MLIIGLNHRTAELDTRERAAFEPAQLPDALRQLSNLPAIQEAIILSTCNRVELLTRVENTESGRESMETFLCDTSRIPRKDLQMKLYRYADDTAVRHLFRVASSLDSMILGEPQILGQIKSSYATAAEAGTVGAWLNSILQAALYTAKRVRTETSIGDYAVSVSSAAVELARKVFGSLRGHQVLIVGAGEMGETTLRNLAKSELSAIRVTNRREKAAQDLAGAFGGEAVPFDRLVKWISLSDIVITSTGAKEILIDRAQVQSVMAERKNAPVVFIDISVPRNVDPSVGTIDNAFYYDVDDLGAVVEANLQERCKEAAVAEKIVDQEVEVICRRLRSLESSPVVGQLQHRIEEICHMELKRYLRKASPRSEAERKELEVMVSRIAGKIAHPLIMQFRSDHKNPSREDAYLDTIKRIFKLQKNPEP